MDIKALYDVRTSTLTYIVFDPATKDAVIIDPVLDYTPIGSKIWTESVDKAIAFIKANALNLHYILETHAHADHLSGSQMIKKQFPEALTAIGSKITLVQEVFKDIFALPDAFATDGSQFDRLLHEDEVLQAGSLAIEVLLTPGHTPACTTFKVGDAIFTGDALFMPDQGTGRCDFPAGSASDLYDAVTRKLYTLPDETRVFVGHDYQPGGREMRYQTTVLESKQHNVQLPEHCSREAFIAFRDTRDSGLNAPHLLFQSVQVNVDAGHLPTPERNARRYLKIPINIFRPEPDPDELELRKIP